MTWDEAAITIDRTDAAALVGVLAIVEGHARAGDVSPRAMAHLRRRLVSDLGVDSSAHLDELLGMLNQRLRRALGDAA